MNAHRKLHEAYHEFGEFYCEVCEEMVDLSDADTLDEARDVALDHRDENHD